MKLTSLKPGTLIALVFLSAFLSGCASNNIDFDGDPDLFTSSEDIPERPGLLEGLTDNKLEKSF